MGVESELDHQVFHDALKRGDVAAISRQLIDHQFLLIHLADEADSSEETEILGALTAQFEDRDYLVAFSSQERASEFVEKRSDLFADESEVGGFWVDGRTMLDYLDDELGLLMNPDGVGHQRLSPKWITKILNELNLE
ncbi:SseB family protein [Neorhodopirellula lusitana]|uniref:SseB family protein n=1 Tax=Neorhodopirellula lusitana TaxID=445327 RepID=UPI00385007BA